MRTGAAETFANRIVWQSCYNNSGQTIPPFSVVMAGDWNLPDMSGFQTASPYLDVTQPDGTGAPANHYITWEVAIPPNSFGSCARPDQTPLVALLAGAQSDSDDAPFRRCGPQPGQWTLTRDAPGFVMLAEPQEGYALVVPSRGPYVGKTSGQIALYGTGSVTVYWSSSGLIGQETATSLVLKNVYDRWQTLGDQSWVLFDWTGQGWEIIGGAGANQATWIVAQCTSALGPYQAGSAYICQVSPSGGGAPTSTGQSATVVNFRNNTTVAGAYYVCFPITTTTNNEGHSTTVYALDNQATFL